MDLIGISCLTKHCLHMKECNIKIKATIIKIHLENEAGQRADIKTIMPKTASHQLLHITYTSKIGL